MRNIYLWIGTMLIYWLAIAIPWNPLCGNPQLWWLLGIVALATLPVNIGGNIYTLFGNAEGGDSIYAFCSLYQNAKANAVSIVGLCNWQRAGGNAVTVAGVTLYQASDAHTLLIGGASLYQTGYYVIHLLGVNGCQKAKSRAGVGVGLSIYQHGADEAHTVIGLAIWQEVKSKIRTFGALCSLRA